MIDSQRSYNISTTLQDSMKYSNDADIKEWIEELNEHKKYELENEGKL